MRQHLANKHRIKAGAYFEGLIKVARLYAGKSELEDLPRVKPKKEPEGSLTTSETTVNRQDSYTEQDQVMNVEPEKGQDLQSSQPPSDPKDNDHDEDYKEFQLQEEYFISATPKNALHKWLILFYKWLNTADAGRKKNRNRLQHASHSRIALEDLQAGSDGIDILSQDEGQIVWTDWVDVKLLERKSCTINGYLGTYGKFLQFVVEEQVRVTDFPHVEDDAKRIFRNMVSKLTGWRKTVDLKGKVETNQRRMDECTYRLTTKDVKVFLSCPTVLSAKKIFDKAKSILTIHKMCEARDSLIMLVSLKTGTRPGAFKNLKLQEYLNANTDPTTNHSATGSVAQETKRWASTIIFG